MDHNGTIYEAYDNELEVAIQFCNRPFPSSVVPLFQNESKWKTFHMKMSSAYKFHFHTNQSHFHKNGFALKTRFETEAQRNSEMAHYFQETKIVTISSK